MKKISFLLLATGIIYFGCSKKNDQSSMQTVQTPKPKTLVANAGRDTSICMPDSGTGYIYKGILDGRRSHDSLGNIVSYVWSEVFGTSPPANSPNIVGSNALTEVEISDQGFGGNNYTFQLEVKDDRGQVAYDTVIININNNFEYEYDGLSWDSTAGALTTISEKFKPGLIQSWPDFTNAVINNSSAYIIKYNGECNALSSWQMIPYVPYDSIQQTNISLFYTLIASPDHGILFPEIFAKTNSGFDFNQKVSIGFDIGFADPWDY
jgi:hypothetical protein